MPDCQSNNGPVATATPSRANKVGNIVVAGGRTRQKQTKNKQQKHICGRKQAIFKAMFYVMPGSVSGEQKAWEKMPVRNSLKPTHTLSSSVVVEAGPAGILHKKRSRHTSRGVSSITALLQQSRRAAGGHYGSAESSPALCSDHQSPVTAHSIEILIAASEATRLQKLCLNLFVVQLANLFFQATQTQKCRRLLTQMDRCAISITERDTGIRNWFKPGKLLTNSQLNTSSSDLIYDIIPKRIIK